MQDERRLAVERAYRDHVDDVYRVARAILGDAEAASDVTHEAYARAYERWDRYDPRRPVRPWLQGIAANLALDALRRRRVRRIVARLEDVGDLAHGDQLDPASDIVRRHAVEDGLATLRPEVRAALVLRHYHGYDYAEIASLLGTSPGNVGSMLSRGHAALRACLAAVLDEAPAALARRAVR
jgi:RNA polymerase sigma-70 factor (ECF subfamily)